MRQAHYFKNKHKKNTIVKSYANKSKKTNICLRKSILYFMEKNMKNTKKDTLKQGGSRRRQIRILKSRKITLYNDERKKYQLYFNI